MIGEDSVFSYCHCASHVVLSSSQLQPGRRRETNRRSKFQDAKKSLFSAKRPADDGDDNDVTPSIKRLRDNASKVEDFAKVSKPYFVHVVPN